MPKFTYTATTRDGKTIHGQVEASSKAALTDTLHKQGIHPVIIKQAVGLNFKFGNSKKKIKLRDLVLFTRQLSTMVSAGVPLTRAFTTLQEQSDDKYFKTVIANITKDIEGGASIGDAFAKYPNIFSEIYINMVKAGEAGGILDEILKRLATQVEKEASMRKKIKGAMMYPMVVGSITVVAFFGIMIFIMPRIAKIITDLGGPDAKLPIYSQIMLDTSAFVQKNAVVMIVAIVIVVFLVLRYIRSPKGKIKYHLLLLNTPIVKDIITKIAIARFARTFASLMGAGVGVLESLEVTAGAIGNKIIEAELKVAAKEVKNGKQLSEPLSQSKYFPPIVSQMLAIGEETGQIDSILLKVADFYEEEVDTVIDGMTAIIEPVIIVVLGVVVGLIAASVMGPISSLSKNIGN
ncbi:MAG: type II secretion system F family protein [Candidatus Saccharibacteria bacterium]